VLKLTPASVATSFIVGRRSAIGASSKRLQRSVAHS
jgi:hypothetical protein